MVETRIIGHNMGLYRDKGKENGNYHSILGFKDAMSEVIGRNPTLRNSPLRTKGFFPQIIVDSQLTL